MSAKFIKFEMTIIYNKNINIFIANCQSLQLAIQSNPIQSNPIQSNPIQSNPCASGDLPKQFTTIPAIQGFIAFTPMEEPTDH